MDTTEKTVTAIVGLLDLMSSEAMRDSQWERNLAARETLLDSLLVLLDVLNPDVSSDVLLALHERYAQGDIERRKPWTLEQVEQFFIDSSTGGMSPISFFFTYAHPRARGDRPAIPMALYRQAWRNVVEREAIHVSHDYVQPARPDYPMDEEAKALALAFTFSPAHGWPAE